MHELIFQISRNPEKSDNYFSVDSLPDWFFYSISDGAEELNEEEKSRVISDWFSEPFVTKKENSGFSINEKAKDYMTNVLQYFIQALEKIIREKPRTADDLIYNLDLGLDLHRLNCAYSDKFGMYFFLDGEMYTLNELIIDTIRYDPNAIYYIEAVFDYHY